jgi:hypothetical protein
MTKATLKSPLDLFKESSEAVKRNLSLFIFLNAVTILGTAWDLGLSIRDKSTGSNWWQVVTHTFTGSSSDPSVNVWLTAIFILGGIILYLMAAILAVRAAQHKHVNFSDIWETFKDKWLKILGTEILVAILVIAGCILFIVPGLYILGRLIIAPAMVIDQDIGVNDALNKSWDYTKGHAWPVFVAFFFGALLSLPSIIPFIGPIIATVLAIAYSLAIPIRYFELKNLKNA